MNRHGARLVYRDFVRRFADDADVAAGNGGLVTMRPEVKKTFCRDRSFERRRGVYISANISYIRQAVYSRAYFGKSHTRALRPAGWDWGLGARGWSRSLVYLSLCNCNQVSGPKHLELELHHDYNGERAQRRCCPPDCLRRHTEVGWMSEWYRLRARMGGMQSFLGAYGGKQSPDLPVAQEI